MNNTTHSRHRPVCSCGWQAVNYSKEYDAHYCPMCDTWIEKKCSDVECEYCKNRPEKPLKEWYIK